jgi:hypothetical protein
MPCGGEAMLYQGVLPIARPERSFEREMGPTAYSVAASWRDSAHDAAHEVAPQLLAQALLTKGKAATRPRGRPTGPAGRRQEK